MTPGSGLLQYFPSMYTDGMRLTTERSATDMHATMPHTSEGELKQWLLEVLPGQGAWTEEKYLWLTDHTTRLVEFTDGYIRVLPLPTDEHRSFLQFLFLAFAG